MNEFIHTREYQSQQELLEHLLAPQPTVIGIEGGPCGGKTTLVNRLVGSDTSERPVVTLPEAATRHIKKLEAAGLSVADLAANDREGFIAFETEVLNTIVQQIESAKERYAGTNAIVIADRVDIAAYLSESEHRQVLDNLGLEMAPMLTMVDQLYYLPSVAREGAGKYNELKATNPSRYETYEQALSTCEANLRAVARHPELHVSWGGDFEKKIGSASAAILNHETESEYKLSWRNVDNILSKIDTAEKSGYMLGVSEIEQSYHRLNGVEFRLRQLDTERDERLYYLTIKDGNGIERHELQRRLDADQYSALSQCPQIGKSLKKLRYDFLKNDWPSSRVRKWSADFYYEPHLCRWEVEVDVDDEQDAAKLKPFNYSNRYTDWQPSKHSARQLAEL